MIYGYNLFYRKWPVQITPATLQDSIHQSAEPVQGHSQGLCEHDQLPVADVALVLFDAGDDQGRDLHAHQIDLPGQVILRKGRLVHGPAKPDPVTADITFN